MCPSSHRTRHRSFKLSLRCPDSSSSFYCSRRLHGPQCISIQEAPQNIGKKTCVAGKVLKVARSENGTFFLDFCEDYKQCPFTAIVLPMDLQDVGDVRALEGKKIELHGKIKKWNGRAEIVLKDIGQLHGSTSAKLPPTPKPTTPTAMATKVPANSKAIAQRNEPTAALHAPHPTRSI
jgi:hypothetical protein